MADMNVSPGIRISIRVTSDTDGMATRKWVEEKLEGIGGQGVQTVNGAGPDESGDVKVNGLPEGAAPNQHLVTDGNGVAKWEEKQFGEIEHNIEWDGNTDGRVSVADMIYKVSDLTPTVEELISGHGQAYAREQNGESDLSQLYQFTEDMFLPVTENGWLFEGGKIACAYADNVSMDGLMFPEAGIYFANAARDYDGTHMEMKTDWMRWTEKKKIDSEYLPYYGLYKLYSDNDRYLHKTADGAYSETKDDIITIEELGDIAANQPIVIMGVGRYAGVVEARSMSYPDGIEWSGINSWGYVRCGDVKYYTAEYVGGEVS